MKKGKAQHGAGGRNAVEYPHHLALRKAQFEELMVNVFTVSAKKRMAAEETAKNAQSRIRERQCQRNNGDCQRVDDALRLSFCQHKSTQHKPDKQASAVTKEDGGRVEIENKEAEHRAAEHQSSNGDVMPSFNQRHGKNRGHGK